MIKKFQHILRHKNIIIPIDIIKEMRLDVRVAIVKDKAIVRIPLYYSKNQMDKTYAWAKDWIIKHVDNNEITKKRFEIRNYVSGEELHINDHTFILDIKISKKKNYSAILKDNTIFIKIPYDASDNELANQKAIKTLQSRIIAKYFQVEVSNRILSINKKYFGFNINNIKLKYNKTNWGSRSAKDNINISTRLLFAPKEVQDYVFIHELAHFKEMNHSPRFWKIVKDIMPDYKDKEKWLKKNGSNCDF